MVATGIQFEYNAQGLPLFARIDLKQYGQRLLPFFKEIGIDTALSPYNQDYVDMIAQAEADVKAGNGKKIAIADLWK